MILTISDGIRIGDEMGSIPKTIEKQTAQIIEFDPTLIRVKAVKYRGSISQRKKYDVIEFEGKYFIGNSDSVFYEIKAGDYILDNIKTHELYILPKAKAKKIENLSEVESFLFRKSML